MKTSADVFDAINALEQRFPVNAWRAGDIDLWPAYRLRLHANSMGSVLANDVVQRPAQRLHALMERASRALWRVPMAGLRDRKGNASVCPGTFAVFFSDGVSFVRLGEAWFDRVMDPVIEVLEGRGHRSLKLTPLAEAHVPRVWPSRFVQPAIDRVKLLASPRRVDTVVAEFAAFHGSVRALFGDAALSLDWLQLQAARLDALAKWFGRLLERSGASHVFVNTYYSLEGLALVQAARRLGLRSIDLQHGIQGPHHIAYARWSSLPRRGYSTLPDEFWVWGAEEASTIEAWRSGCATHAPRVTGNFWLQRWLDGTDPVVAQYLAQARELRAAPATAQALVCLTWGVPEEETTKLIEAAKLCGPSVSWWWRLHPVYASRSAEFARRLEKQGLDGSQVRKATELPLYALLRTADITVAHSSTVIQEAATLGVPSVVTSDYGAELHGHLIQRGSALRAIDARAIADAVMTLSARRRLTGMTMADRGSVGGNSLHAAVEALLPARRASAGERNVPA
jgi:hypothetical protein